MSLSTPMATHINELPVETIDHIMSYLPLADRKSASLVCHRWSEQAFTYRYLASVRLRLKEQSLEDKRVIVEALQASWRMYRNVMVDFGNTGIDLVLILVILNKFGEWIEVFGSQTSFTSWQLKEMLKRLPKIRRLVVNVINERESYVTPEEFPVLESLVDFRSTDAIFEIPGMNAYRMMPSLRNLSLCFQRYVTGNTFIALSSVSSQLKMLEVFADFSRAPIELLDLRQLEILKLWGTNFFIHNEALRQLFMRVPMLSVLFLHVRMSTSLLQVICDNCPQLTSFGFIADRMEHRALFALHKLTNLKILLIDGCLKYHMIDGCRPLPKVETFCIYWHKKHIDLERFVKQLHYMLPNVKTFKVIGTRSKEMDHLLMHHIGKMFTKIIKLTIADFEFPPEDLILDDGFDWIGDLVNVEQLTLSGIPLRKIGCQRGCSKVTRLRLENFDYLLGENLLHVAEIFPNLRFLKIYRCTLITAKDVESLQEVMPNCVINFVERKR
ncbi:uncharacterized protein LOC110674472 [Aedes aegypti]|uniref:Uncharacterized protein n=1 Tax=Aedes aegypti TaxID=7159 RepID=A0A6I8U5R9_AEDAE|nr:uncharacterized protein LOC110674472 [Aedes aegypti]